MLTEWSELFIATAGAAAALAGLTIVALSVNIQLIIKLPGMVARAGATIACLVLILYVAVIGLVPGQPLPVVGAEIVIGALGALVVGVTSGAQLLRARGENPLMSAVVKASFTVGPVLVIFVGGAILGMGSLAGMSVVVVGMVLGFVFSILNTWVLMVEILR